MHNGRFRDTGKPRRSHDEEHSIRADAKIAGDQYVVVQLRPDATRSAYPQGRVYGIAEPARCEHKTTICSECAERWEWDHLVHYSYTECGRDLRDQIIKAKAKDAQLT